MSEPSIFLRYAISLALGILVGMQREFATGKEEGELPAGVRTFALIGVLGCAAVQVSDLLGSVIPLAAVLLILGSLLTAMYLVQVKRGRWGMTTDVAALVTFLAGALACKGQLQ